MIKALSQVARQRHMTFFSIERNWSKKIKSAFLSSLIALFASAFIPSSGAGENEADNSSEPGSSQPQIKKIRLDDNSEVVIVKVTDDFPVLPEIDQWLKQCASCIKQEPPDDDEKETNSSDTEFTVSPQDPPSPSVFQTVESGEKPFQCSLCQKYYKTAASLASHISASHSGEPEVVIVKVTDDFPVLPEIDQWLKQCASCIKQEPPDDDEKETNSSDTEFTVSPQDPPSPSVFQTVESGEKPFQCSLCQKYYKTAASLASHISASHSGEPEVVIVKVTDDFPVLPEIDQWLKQCASCIKQEPPDDDEKETNSSDTEFTVSPQDPPSPSVFQTVESGEKPFQCSLCQKYYKTAASLASHIRASHSGERTCTQCQPPVTLKSAQALADHNRSHHSGERTCTQCQPPVTLNSAKALATHNQSHHSGERTCTRCQPPVTLNSAKALATHNQSHHSGERTCTRCQPPVTLKSAQALATHNKSHHSGERTCTQCQPPVTLNSAKALDNHKFRKHRKRKRLAEEDD